MAEETLVFTQENKKNWNILLETTREIYRRCSESGKDFQITIGNYSSKRSSGQLKAYWSLIKTVKDYMNQPLFGNNFTDEEVSNYMKDKARHYVVINKQEILGSISNKSGCTKEQMKKLIETIIEFGIDNKIPNCDIVDYELDNLLANYK